MKNKTKKNRNLYRISSKFILATVCCLFLLSTFPGVSSAKFLQSFLCRVGGSELAQGNEHIMSKYDIIALQRFHYDDIGGDTWSTVKALNPDTEFFLYQSGTSSFDDQDDYSPLFLSNVSRWNTSKGHSMGSLNGDNPELFLLDSTGRRINHKGFNNRWYMDFGQNSYIDFFIEATISDIPNQEWAADGVFVDNTMSIISEVANIPQKYNTDTLWASAMNKYVNGVSAGFQKNNLKGFFNRCNTRNKTGYEAWIALDRLSNPPYAVLEEGAFAVEWGNGDVQFYPETDWKRQIDLLSEIHNSKAVYISHSDLVKGGNGIDNFGKSVSFWDILWYSMGSYHIGKNTTDNNSYWGFVESYNNISWYDEFDHIDLGNAMGNYNVTNYGGKNIYWREFEKGYVFVNPTNSDVSTINLPEPIKLLNHNNFKDNPSNIPSITSINLKSHRAAIILKETFDFISLPPESSQETTQNPTPATPEPLLVAPKGLKIVDG